MKARLFGGTLLLAALTLFSCDDTTGTLGIDMLPESDAMNTRTQVFEVTTRSFVADSVYARSSTGYVGRFTDPDFGYYEAGFLTEFNCLDNFELPRPYQYDATTGKGSGNMGGDTVMAMSLVVHYSTWFGDSLNACRMSAYELDQNLEKNRYTNIDPEEYYNRFDSKLLLGRKAYSAFDATVPDSVRNATNSSGYPTYSPSIVFPLDKKEFGEKRLLHLNWEHPEYFKNSAAFRDNVLKGIYLKSDYGDGTILYVDRVDLNMTLRMHYVNDTTGVAYKKEDGTDSLFTATYIVFSSTKEVIQANRFMNSDIIKQKAAETEHTYVKSPAGIFTEATLPYEEIYQELGQDTLNAVKLNFIQYRQPNDDYPFSMEAPENVLLIRKQDLQDFFEDNKITDNITSYTVANGSVTTNQYTFSNIVRLVSTCIEEKQVAKGKAREEAGSGWDEAQWEAKWEKENPDWDKVLLIPVTVTTDSSSSTSTIIGISHDLKPTYAKLKGGDDKLQIEVTYTRFGQ